MSPNPSDPAAVAAQSEPDTPADPLADGVDVALSACEACIAECESSVLGDIDRCLAECDALCRTADDNVLGGIDFTLDKIGALLIRPEDKALASNDQLLDLTATYLGNAESAAPPPPDPAARVVDPVCPEGWTWNEDAQVCIPPAGSPALPSCPEGYVYDPIQERCTGAVTTGPGGPAGGEPPAGQAPTGCAAVPQGEVCYTGLPGTTASVPWGTVSLPPYDGIDTFTQRFWQTTPCPTTEGYLFSVGYTTGGKFVDECGVTWYLWGRLESEQSPGADPSPGGSSGEVCPTPTPVVCAEEPPKWPAEVSNSDRFWMDVFGVASAQ